MSFPPRPDEIPLIIRLIAEMCGIQLDETKGYFMESRLGPLVRQYGCQDYVELLTRAISGSDRTLFRRTVDAITTRETLFFRDAAPFNALSQEVLPVIIQKRTSQAHRRRLRIWSAACSSGQEPYSIAITLLEALPNVNDWDIEIFATDISESAISQAELGRYSAAEMGRGVEFGFREKYFQRIANDWCIVDSVRRMVRFQRFDLRDSIAAFGRFDIIFCRNVAIYFSLQDRRSLFLRLAHSLNKDGTLFVGASESISDLGEHFVPQHSCGTVFYQPGAARKKLVCR